MIYDIGDTLEKVSQTAKVDIGTNVYPIGSKVRIIRLVGEEIEVTDMFGDTKFISEKYLVDWKIECEFHRWEHYEGFTRVFQYCTKCDKKWEIR
jgi:hypothetical protein